eukprot:1695516-Amphidinium_carterae.2
MAGQFLYIEPLQDATQQERAQTDFARLVSPSGAHLRLVCAKLSSPLRLPGNYRANNSRVGAILVAQPLLEMRAVMYETAKVTIITEEQCQGSFAILQMLLKSFAAIGR